LTTTSHTYTLQYWYQYDGKLHDNGIDCSWCPAKYTTFFCLRLNRHNWTISAT